MSTHHQLFTALFSKHYLWLRQRVSNTLGCEHSADDVTTDAFVRLLGLQNLSDIRDPRALLSTIAKRLMINNWRRADLERAYLATLDEEPANTVSSPEEHAMLIDTLLLLDRLLSGLALQAKEVFIHSLFDGWTYEQIGHQLSISKSRVHQHMERAYLACLLALAE
ncbi:sigma-70 family RNA polymerase sigma factor [Pseudomonas carnis]|uniref:sigma-70 family RNA polymerase sigma factor n=1 Tax=Pseudomonas carnis TaxID=2487355 RepID=UPI001D21A9F9|nr:sigma-70 family RNA polymerase sigma factor [Pseudomonas carnis]CAH0270239.1 putative RNA polymerase sigma factor FecI [Pseudomonas carnis]CAH0284865.1 putative RNA polymerase sigma factor FecI [Pseudomonas carnis]CAH0304191.1 putative RNA polymerase sigma factor FecI [Pseudomonas carnis]CAH0308855.1 putative RNA polymerase sigma factor FecI [Pseudomonas carnis]